MTSKKLPKISSDFAILDVKLGRKALAKLFAGNEGRRLIPIVITGNIVGQFSSDDGESIEFSVNVDGVRFPAAVAEEA